MSEADLQKISTAIDAALAVLDATTDATAKATLSKSIKAMQRTMDKMVVDDLASSVAAVGAAATEMQKVVEAANPHLDAQVLQEAKAALDNLKTAPPSGSS